MCISSLIKHYILLITFFVIGVTIGGLIMFILLPVFGMISFFIKCPKCNKALHVSDKCIYRPHVSLYCDKCGQNLKKCNS